MVVPDGTAYPNLVGFDEVDEPARLAYTHGEPDDPEQFRVTVTFAEIDTGTTELRVETTFPSAADLEGVIEFGADDCAIQTLGNLAAHLEQTTYALFWSRSVPAILPYGVGTDTYTVCRCSSLALQASSVVGSSRRAPIEGTTSWG